MAAQQVGAHWGGGSCALWLCGSLRCKWLLHKALSWLQCINKPLGLTCRHCRERDKRRQLRSGQWRRRRHRRRLGGRLHRADSGAGSREAAGGVRVAQTQVADSSAAANGRVRPIALQGRHKGSTCNGTVVKAQPAARPPSLHGCRPCWAACLPGGNTKSSCCRSCRGADSPINSSHSPQRRPAPLQHLAERPARLPCSQATVQCIQRRSRRRQRQSSSPDRALDLFSALRGLRGLPLGC